MMQGHGVAIAGIGCATRQGQPGWRAEDYALAAAREALADAAIGKDAIDGLITCKALSGAGGDIVMGRLLGLNPSYSATLDYGTCNFSIHLAAMVIAAGLAETVLLTYGTDQGSNGGDFARYGNHEIHHGMVDPIGTMAAMMFRRYQHLYGASEADLGAVVVAQRKWASLNPDAVHRDPITIDDYLEEPHYIAPVRRSDIAGFHDGGAAMVITSVERARDMPHVLVRLAGKAQTAQLRNVQNEDNLERRWMRGVADRALAGAGVLHKDIDLLMVQDPASVWVLQMIEALGFADPGGGGAMIAAGETALGGRLPLNTSGGHLSERYMWGWFHIVEIIRQLRGACGPRQVNGARLAMHASTMVAQKGSASVFEAMA
ncbi:MAG: thiolase family protein [Novosphingobium sp.]|nr:thiolase family protein [Novosphingobium sp.]